MPLLPGWKTRIPALSLFLFAVAFAGAENRAARLDARRWTTAVFVHCTGSPQALETGLQALINDQLQAIAELDVVEGADLQLAARAVGTSSEPDRQTAKTAGLDSAIEVRCLQRDNQIQWEASLTMLASDDSTRAESTPVPIRQAGQIPFRLVSSLLQRAREAKRLPDSVYTAADQALLSRIVRPQYETLLAYGRARSLERINPYASTQHLREALTIDPDFYPAYARLFFTVYVSQPIPYAAELDIASQTRVRLNSIEAIWIARAFYDLGLNARERSWPSEAYFRRSTALLQSGGRDRSLLVAMNSARTGESYLPTTDRLVALYHVQTAREMMESQGLEHNVFYAINLTHLSILYALDGKRDLATWLMDRARRFDGHDSLFGAFVRANGAAILLRRGATAAALSELRAARAILRDRQCGHSLMYLMLMVQEANAVRTLGDTRAAEDIYESILNRARILGLEGTQAHVDALNGIAITTMARGDNYASQNYLRIAYAYQARIGMRTAGEFYSVTQMPVRGRLGLVEEERQKVASYTGAYSYAAHARHIQSRTYAGRLDDTNVLLKDLFDSRHTRNAALNDLRQSLLGSSPRLTGEGAHFIDIGPAIANRASPGVTAVSVARDFPGMSIIAVDLPEQVEIFAKQVLPGLRSRVLEFPNFHVVAANGVAPLKDQFAQTTRWLEPRKSRPAIKARDAIIIRAANSIDVYESWQQNEEAMVQIARDYQENPILYSFNRTLLFKPAGATTFTIVGAISKAGFDHNYETFDRGGEAAYSLIEPGS